MKCLQEAAYDSVKSNRKPPVTIYFLRIFPAANERSALENIDQSQSREYIEKYCTSFLIFKKYRWIEICYLY